MSQSKYSIKRIEAPTHTIVVKRDMRTLLLSIYSFFLWLFYPFFVFGGYVKMLPLPVPESVFVSRSMSWVGWGNCSMCADYL